MELRKARREPALPRGWYPPDGETVRRSVREWTEVNRGEAAHAVVVPHAGWVFSGRLAAEGLARLAGADTIAVIGGHLSGGAPLLYAQESVFGTVAGDLRADTDLMAALFGELHESGIPAPVPDTMVDNSIEVLLPMIAVLWPAARILWLRSPPRPIAKELGAALGRASATLGIRVACVGSTDLTHYGPAYGFSPAGGGEKAEKWVRSINDKGFVDALLDMNCEAALAHAVKKGAACSPGAAVSALSFAIEAGATEAELIGYATSLDVRRADSFVGYASIAFR